MEVGVTKERVRDALARNHKVDISTLGIAPDAKRWYYYHPDQQPDPLRQPFDCGFRISIQPQLIFVSPFTSMFLRPQLRDIVDGRGSGVYESMPESLRP